MKPEGIRRRFIFEGGKWADYAVYSICSEDLGIECRPG